MLNSVETSIRREQTSQEVDVSGDRSRQILAGEPLLAPTTGIVRLDSYDVYYESLGSGEPLVLVHSGMGSIREWDAIRPLLASRFQTIAYDRCGIGRSSGTPFQPDIVERGVDELKMFMEKLDLRSTHVFGACIGGAIALLSAAGGDVPIRSVISADALFHGGIDLRERLRILLRPWDGMPPPFRETVCRIQGLADPRPFYEEFRSLYAANEPVGYATSTAFDIRSRVANIGCPVLFMHGDRDPFWGVEQPMSIFRAVSKASLSVLPDCGHYPHLDCPAMTAMQSLQFLAGKGGAVR